MTTFVMNKLSNEVVKRTKITFRNLKKTKQKTYLVNDKFFVKVYNGSIKDNILRELFKQKSIKISDLIKKVKKKHPTSVYNELNYLENAEIITIKNQEIRLKRKIEVKKEVKK